MEEKEVSEKILCLGPCKKFKSLARMKKVGAAFFCRHCISITSAERLKDMALSINIPKLSLEDNQTSPE